MKRTILRNALFYSFLSFPFCLTAQSSCNFKIDTSKILLNKNLDTFILKLQTESFTTFNNKNAIPKEIKDELDCLTKKFSIANPNQDFACCCTSSNKLPKRKLIYLSKSQNTLVMTYLTGGWGEMTHLLLIQFDKGKITDLWSGSCDENIKSNKEIITYLNENRNKHWGLNSNIIYF